MTFYYIYIANFIFLGLLTIAKRNYCLTKLEIVRFIIIIKKLSHLIGLLHISIIIQIDYIIIFDIM